MKKLFTTVLAFACIACAKDIVEPTAPQQTETSAPSTRIIIDSDEDQISLGQKLTNPYNIDVMNSAYEGLYGEVDFFDPNYYYVRFLPSDSLDVDFLSSSGWDLYDHPLDYEIVSDGDYYQDPYLPVNGPTWMYTVVPSNYQFTSVPMRYEILEECYIPDEDEEIYTNSNIGDVNSTHGASMNSRNIDFEELERRAYIISGNGDMLDDSPQTRAIKSSPTGYVYLFNEDNPTPIAGAKVKVYKFVKMDKAITDNNGHYIIPKKFKINNNVNITVEFENTVEDFRIYRSLVPAKVMFFGIPNNQVAFIKIHSKEEKGYSDGGITSKESNFAWASATIFNAANKYYNYCEQLGLNKPPRGLRILTKLRKEYGGGAPMLSKVPINGVDDLGAIADVFGVDNTSTIIDIMKLFKMLLPDICINCSKKEGLFKSDLYSKDAIAKTTFHELAHASHYSVVGDDFWLAYINEIIESYLATREGPNLELYGVTEASPHCMVGEMWAGYCAQMLACIDGDSTVNDNKIVNKFSKLNLGAWVRPHVLINIAIQLGLDVKDIYNAVIGEGTTTTINSGDKLKESLVRLYGSSQYYTDLINREFDYYYKGYVVSYLIRNTSPMQRYLYTYIDKQQEPLCIYMEAKSLVKICDIKAMYHIMGEERFIGAELYPFREYASIYDTNVMDMPLREWQDSVLNFHSFFNLENWTTSEVDSANLIYKCIYETDF